VHVQEMVHKSRLQPRLMVLRTIVVWSWEARIQVHRPRERGQAAQPAVIETELLWRWWALHSQAAIQHMGPQETWTSC